MILPQPKVWARNTQGTHAAAHIDTDTQTCLLHTHTHTHFQSLPFPIPCPSFSLSLNSHIFCHSSFSFNKRRPWFAEALSGISRPLSYSRSSVFSFFPALSFCSYSDRHSLLLKLQSGFPLNQSAHHQFVIIYNGLFCHQQQHILFALSSFATAALQAA